MVRENRIQEYGLSLLYLLYKYINEVGENPLNGSDMHPNAFSNG